MPVKMDEIRRSSAKRAYPGASAEESPLRKLGWMIRNCHARRSGPLSLSVLAKNKQMLDYNSAAIVATLVSAIPLFVVARVVYFAFVSKTRFISTDCMIDTHEQPKSEDGEPIRLVLRYSYRVGDRTFTGRRYYFGSKTKADLNT